MNFWKRIADRLSRGGHPAVPTMDLQATLGEAYGFLKSEEYTKAREILLKTFELRDRIRDRATIDWILRSLEATWLFQDRFEEQIEFFSDYLRRYPSDSAAYAARAAALWYTDKLHDAVSDYSRALELNPTDLLSRAGRGQVLAELGENATAMEDLDIALRILGTAPKLNDVQSKWCHDVEAFVRRGRGVAFASLGQIWDAMNEFDESIALSPENAWVYFSRAKIYDRLDDRRHALSDYGQAMANDKPRLSPTQREHARERIADLSGEQAPN